MLAYCINMRRYRLDRGMSQQELADMTGYKSRSSINKIEKGLTMVTLEQAQKIANALNVELKDLIPEYSALQMSNSSNREKERECETISLHGDDTELYHYLYSRTDDVGKAFKQLAIAMIREERFKAISEKDKSFLLDFRRLNANNKQLILNMMGTMLQQQKAPSVDGEGDSGTQKGTPSLQQVPSREKVK